MSKVTFCFWMGKKGNKKYQADKTSVVWLTIQLWRTIWLTIYMSSNNYFSFLPPGADPVYFSSFKFFFFFLSGEPHKFDPSFRGPIQRRYSNSYFFVRFSSLYSPLRKYHLRCQLLEMVYLNHQSFMWGLIKAGKYLANLLYMFIYLALFIHWNVYIK